jgi:hypothetical protein
MAGPEMDGSTRLMRRLRGLNEVPMVRGASLEQHAFLTRPYWSRLWIIQELCVARNVLIACGFETVPLVAFRRSLVGDVPVQELDIGSAVYSLDVNFRHAVANFGILIPYNLIDLIKTYKLSPPTLAYLLTRSSQSECTDSRDRVFSLLGLASDLISEDLTPDYTISPCNVSCATIRSILKHSSYPSREAKVFLRSRCCHQPLEEYLDLRGNWNGIACRAWWCCLDVALLCR